MRLFESLQSFELHLQEVIGCVDDLLSNDEDMLGLLLTEQHKSQVSDRTIDPAKHSAAELLLEDYNRQLRSLLSDVNFLQKRVQTKQELAAIGRDAYRNRMISVNMQLAVLSVCLSSMSFAAS